jgi:gas vesicle protein
MHEHNQKRNVKIRGGKGFFVGLAGLVAGGLIGAGVMLLWAPQSGKKTRDQVMHEGIELRDQVGGIVDDVVGQTRSRVNKIATAVRKQGKKLGHQGEDALEHVVAAAQA